MAETDRSRSTGSLAADPLGEQPRQFRLATLFVLVAGVAALFALTHAAGPDPAARLNFAAFLSVCVGIIAVCLVVAHRGGKRHEAAAAARQAALRSVDISKSYDAPRTARDTVASDWRS